MKVKLLSLGLTILWLAGCTTMSLSTATEEYQKVDWQQRKAALSKIQHWDISGAFSVTYGDVSHIANYSWHQKNQHYHIKISSSLNLFSLALSGKPGEATLQEGGEHILQASSAESLLQKRLGWHLPVTNLRFWIRGAPAPGRHQAQFDQFSHLIRLNQQGWQVLLSSYTSFQQSDVPRSLLIRGHGLTIKIVIKHWRP